MSVATAAIDWRDCEFVSMANAARIVGREPGWAQNAAAMGDVEAVQLPTGGPPVITTHSLKAFLERSRRVLPGGAGGTSNGRHLRLVASN